jgi:hypothetical protein
MRNNREYQICKDIAIYLRFQYPDVIFHFDLAGLNLSRAQAGMMKSIQGDRGWPDLFIAVPSKDGRYKGLFIELKPEGTKIFKKSGEFTTPHIAEQYQMICNLLGKGYKAMFCIGFDDTKKKIDEYLKT